MGKVWEIVDERVREERKLLRRVIASADKDGQTNSMGSCEASLGSQSEENTQIQEGK